MMSLKDDTDALIDMELKSIGYHLENPIRAKISAHGDRQFNVAAIAKQFGLNSNQFAEGLAEKLSQHPSFESVVATGSYVNLSFSKEIIIQTLLERNLTTDKPKKILIDFGGPNVAKALHVGHLRSLVIGGSFRRLLFVRGHYIESDIHYGDWGLPMGMLISHFITNYSEDTAYSLETRENLAEYLEVIYPQLVKECAEDEARMADAQLRTVELQNGKYRTIFRNIVAASLNTIMPQVRRLDATFDLLNGESHAQDDIEDVINIIPHREDEGAVIIDVALPDDKKKFPPIIFQKKDGGYTYAASDLATLYDRMGSGFDTVLYVVDNRQSLHFEQVFRAAKHYTDMELKHIGFGTVNGADGKPYKTREGGVPTLAHMLDTTVEKALERTQDSANAEIIGIGAIKYADLITNRDSGYIFDLERMMAPEGKTGPYLQYAVTRIKSIYRLIGHENETGDRCFKYSRPLPESIRSSFQNLLPVERELLLACANLQETLEATETQMSLTILAEYAYLVAQKFSKFYKECAIADVKDGRPTRTDLTRDRLRICDITYSTLLICIDILGIDVPEKM